ncbi:hypothetical protein HPP92_027054 [Vanilla planifolia]|uniref:WHIM2 domain-containing protein n=1 Tax=Vanilla planifolia TaxID=51239 RepID=A0A835PEQ1_VANPL|nr:hypothetical protein HPP92_027054 [Vanilla planifolia]
MARKGRKQKKEEDLLRKEEENLQKEIEKLFNCINCLGKDRNHNRYWFFRREGRLFVETLDSSKWGYYSTKEEDSMRERDLKRHLEKCYMKISTALQKRSKDVAQKALVEEGELRRSTRVRDKPRFNPAMAFLRYVNRWRED